jgi:hypothetical protein
MTEKTENLTIRLRLKGGSGPNSNWLWELVDAKGGVVKSGTISGPEHKAFATATQAKAKLLKAEAKPR